MEGRYVNILLPGREKYLTVCEVEVKGRIPQTESYKEKNVALQGEASQSSRFDGLTYARNAIDGNRDPSYHSGSCTHTKLQADPWWRLDLQSIHRVTSVTITNRGDCCPERINGAEIRIGNSMENNGNNNPVCAVVSTIPAGETVTYQCEGMVGRYINIIRPGCFKFLTLCEVEVDATHVPDNAASHGKATQSSTGYNGGAQKAIDKNRNPVYNEGSCTHTQGENDPWWRVDLLKTHRVTSVTITNRGDCCENRLNGAEIRIGNSLRNNGNENPVCAVISRIREADTITFECHDMEGRYINVFLPGRHKYLTLCEVEVNGTAVSDGTHRVTSVTITNRGDCCEDRLDGAEIRIGNSLRNNGNENPVCTVISRMQKADTITFECHDMEGRYINSPSPSTAVKKPNLKLKNVALRGKATQSSVHGTGFALNAIDGNRKGHYLSGSCTHTNAQADPWWRVDLLRKYKVTSVTVTNREDCCAERINGAEIRIGNSLKNNGNSNPVCAQISSIPAGGTITFQCEEMEGRYVNIFLPGTEKRLTLCEVEVHGPTAKSPRGELSPSLVERVVMRRGKLYFTVKMPDQGQKKRSKKRNKA
ncbi:hypothetical protein JZ751_009629 [Albula glossodonta]|uniref:Fucolectin tachylectin-4 pentraxin-1 domain-containing protein n=1 Tax=Albula glossodonta TaxID=121402 RepID=A0A8T2MKN1_9TELE|nr:hypothetical protein JZ751_012973 [Albula glossodonta]KAG9345088.1 hypothetical protein JZ751_009629 [Albula glossodonta]